MTNQTSHEAKSGLDGFLMFLVYLDSYQWVIGLDWWVRLGYASTTQTTQTFIRKCFNARVDSCKLRWNSLLH